MSKLTSLCVNLIVWTCSIVHLFDIFHSMCRDGGTPQPFIPFMPSFVPFAPSLCTLHIYPLCFSYPIIVFFAPSLCALCAQPLYPLCPDFMSFAPSLCILYTFVPFTLFTPLEVFALFCEGQAQMLGVRAGCKDRT